MQARRHAGTHARTHARTTCIILNREHYSCAIKLASYSSAVPEARGVGVSRTRHVPSYRTRRHDANERGVGPTAWASRRGPRVVCRMLAHLTLRIAVDLVPPIRNENRDNRSDSPFTWVRLRCRNYEKLGVLAYGD